MNPIFILISFDVKLVIIAKTLIVVNLFQIHMYNY